MGRKLKQLLALELLEQTEVQTWSWLGKKKFSTWAARGSQLLIFLSVWSWWKYPGESRLRKVGAAVPSDFWEGTDLVRAEGSAEGISAQPACMVTKQTSDHPDIVIWLPLYHKMLFVISDMAGRTHKRAEDWGRDLPPFQLWLLDGSRWYVHFTLSCTLIKWCMFASYPFWSLE